MLKKTKIDRREPTDDEILKSYVRGESPGNNRRVERLVEDGGEKQRQKTGSLKHAKVNKGAGKRNI